MKINQNHQIDNVKVAKEKALAEIEKEYRERKEYTEFLYEVLEHRIRMGYDRIPATIEDVSDDIKRFGINCNLDNASLYSSLSDCYEGEITERGFRWENGEKRENNMKEFEVGNWVYDTSGIYEITDIDYRCKTPYTLNEVIDDVSVGLNQPLRVGLI